MSQNEPTIHELFDLRGKVAMVTGAAGYLGRSLAHALAEAGATVVATSRAAQRAEHVAQGLPTNEHQRHGGVVLDHLDDESITTAFRQAVEAWGQIDILVNNGHAASAADWTRVTHGQFTEQLANASGYFVLAREFHEHRVACCAAGSVIMMGSMYGLVGSYPDAYDGVCNASPVAYHTLKGGLLQMTRHLAVYWAADGVRVNALCPGPFPDASRAPAAMVARLEERVPLGRMGNPAELKGAIVFLASGASSYMTGQVLVVDGGWTAW